MAFGSKTVGGSYGAALWVGAWRRPGREWLALLPCPTSLLDDVALVGSKIHVAKSQEEHPHHTHPSPLSLLAEDCVGVLSLGGVAGV